MPNYVYYSGMKAGPWFRRQLPSAPAELIHCVGQRTVCRKQNCDYVKNVHAAQQQALVLGQTFYCNFLLQRLPLLSLTCQILPCCNALPSATVKVFASIVKLITLAPKCMPTMRIGIEPSHADGVHSALNSFKVYWPYIVLIPASCTLCQSPQRHKVDSVQLFAACAGCAASL